MNISLSKLRPYLYHAKFDTRYNMCSTMVRIAEHYESPEFKGKPFTLQEFKRWYTKSQNKKKFTYYTDWSGYNVPSKELKPFFTGKFDPLSPKEKKMLSLLKDIKGKYYLIATFKKEKTLKETLAHETTHAVYSFESKYKTVVNEYLYGKDTKELEQLLIKKGYSNEKKITLDEMNAYLTNDMDWLRKKGLKGKQYNKYSKELINLRKPYYWNNNDPSL